ncbi:MAG: hypothetical protein GF347_03395 [Candidatus Moranbacteria bacterium]|nr:hypothetical protein [Candidatus Moranbacteria bacterium]
MQKYLQVFKIYWGRELEYRSNLVVSLILEVLKMTVALILWLAIFQSKESIAEFNLVDILAYFAVLPMVGTLTNINLCTELGYEIRGGKVSDQLIKPFSIYLYYYAKVISEKFNQLVILLPFYVLLILIISKFVLQANPFSLFNLIISLVFIVLAFQMSYFLELVFSWIAFWIDDAWSFEHFKSIALGVFGGLAFPLDFVSGTLRLIIEILPFKFFYYIPISYLIGKRPLENLVTDLGLLSFWIVILFLISKILWKKGIVKYEAYGH